MLQRAESPFRQTQRQYALMSILLLQVVHSGGPVLQDLADCRLVKLLQMQSTIVLAEAHETNYFAALGLFQAELFL